MADRKLRQRKPIMGKIGVKDSSEKKSSSTRKIDKRNIEKDIKLSFAKKSYAELKRQMQTERKGYALPNDQDDRYQIYSEFEYIQPLQS